MDTTGNEPAATPAQAAAAPTTVAPPATAAPATASTSAPATVSTSAQPMRVGPAFPLLPIHPPNEIRIGEGPEGAFEDIPFPDDPRLLSSTVMTDVVAEAMGAAKRVNYILRHAKDTGGGDYTPPRDVNHPDIQVRKLKSFIVAVRGAGQWWWKAAASIAALAGVDSSDVQRVPLKRLLTRDEDFIAKTGVEWNKDVALKKDITHYRVSVELDWRLIFQRDDYDSFNRRSDWLSMVSAVETSLARVMKDKIGLPQSGPFKGMLYYAHFVQTAGHLPNGAYYLYLERPLGQAAPTVEWQPLENRILYENL